MVRLFGSKLTAAKCTRDPEGRSAHSRRQRGRVETVRPTSDGYSSDWTTLGVQYRCSDARDANGRLLMLLGYSRCSDRLELTLKQPRSDNRSRCPPSKSRSDHFIKQRRRREGQDRFSNSCAVGRHAPTESGVHPRALTSVDLLEINDVGAVKHRQMHSFASSFEKVGEERRCGLANATLQRGELTKLEEPHTERKALAAAFNEFTLH